MTGLRQPKPSKIITIGRPGSALLVRDGGVIGIGTVTGLVEHIMRAACATGVNPIMFSAPNDAVPFVAEIAGHRWSVITDRVVTR